ncbi:MAG: hypothetical protein MK212_03725 [Saprospiraceae bacterium]|nr:hypothetical protein [Saprospiraceae bacterium]
MVDNILDDYRLETSSPEGDIFKLFAWIFVATIAVVFIVTGSVLFMDWMEIPKRSIVLRDIHRGLQFIPATTVLNLGIFVAYLILFSQTFERYLKGQALKTFILSLVVVVLALFIFTIGSFFSDYLAGFRIYKYWTNWGVLFIGHALPIIAVYRDVYKTRSYVLLIPSYACLVLVQSFLLSYFYSAKLKYILIITD